MDNSKIISLIQNHFCGDNQAFKAEVEKTYNGDHSPEVLQKAVSSLIMKFDPDDLIKDILIDLAILNWVLMDEDEGDFLDSEDWQEIENLFIEGGTELLNVMTYLKDCNHHELEPSLHDYLHDFLLVNEDDFQEEMEIYEGMIKIEESFLEDFKIVIAQKEQVSEDLRDVFVPMMGFFYQLSNDKSEVKDLGISDVEQQVTAFMIDFYKGLKEASKA